MKTIRSIQIITALAVLIILSCADPSDEPMVIERTTSDTTYNVYEYVVMTAEMDSLEKAVARAGAEALFRSPGSFTLLAPTNQAFANYLTAHNSWNAIDDIPVDKLTQILNYHILSNLIFSAELMEDSYGTSVNNEAPNNENTVIEVDVANGVQFNNSSSVVEADIELKNGLIHTIDAVLSPGNLVDIASNDERFSSLVEALTAYDFNYIDTLNSKSIFTVFAPSNDAFQALLNSNSSWNMISDIDSAILSAVINYHIISAANTQSKNLRQGMNIPTLHGDTLVVDLSNGTKLTTSSGQNVNIFDLDLQGTNGVIHAVDSVLLPN